MSGRSLLPSFGAPLVLAAGAFAPHLAASEDAFHLSIVRQGDDSVGSIEPGDYFGAAVATGDFNGDGYEDLATGAPWDGPGSEGSVVVSYGSEFGLTHVGAQLLSHIGAGIPDFEKAEFGFALAAGDFDGDGFDDLAVGAPGAEVQGHAAAGQVFLYYGSGDPNGPLGGGPTTSFIHTSVNDVVEAGDRFGHSLSAGTIGREDGHADLAIGSPGENGGAGAVSWLMGASPLGLRPNSGDTLDPSELPVSPGGGDRFGWAVAIGELRGDNAGGPRGDLAVGEPFWDLDSVVDVGRVVVLGGVATGLSSAEVDEYLPLDVGMIDVAGTLFGWALATGDMFAHGDVRDDLAVSALNGNSGSGAVAVMSNTGAGIGGAGAWVELLQSDGAETPEAADEFGYALAAGDFDDDGVDDLAVGSPSETLPAPVGTVFSGLVQLFPGGPPGPGGAGSETWREDDLFDDPSPFAKLGHALAFGRFDGSGRANLAAGAPGQAADAGQVYVIAPWRQVLPMPSRSSIAVDCEDNIIFSQKPFELRYLGSTTKIMTVLLACEAVQLPEGDPGKVDGNYVYTVPGWLADAFPPASRCSKMQPVFEAGEPIELIDLMRACIAISANDAAYAIAEILTGEQGTEWKGYADTSTAFAVLMNERAAQIGMHDTLFTNPAGADDGGGQSTAYDMYLLCREALANPLMRSIVGTTEWDIVRHLAGGDLRRTYEYDFLMDIQDLVPSATGVKPGWAANAETVGCFAARGENFPHGEAIVTTLYTEEDLGEPFYPPAAQLLALSLEDCGGVTLPGPGSLDPHGWGPGSEPVDPDSESGTTFQSWGLDLDGGPAEDVVFEIVLEAVSSPSLVLDLVVQRDSAVLLEPGQGTEVALSTPGPGVLSHDGFVVANHSDSETVTLELEGPTNGVVVLQPGDVLSVPPSVSPSPPPFRFHLSNIGATAAPIGVAELGYRLALELGPLPVYPESAVVHLAGVDHAIRSTVGFGVSGVAGEGRVATVGYPASSPGGYDPCRPSWTLLGEGVSGTNGEPYIGLDADPTMGETIHVALGNSWGQDTVGILLVAFEPLGSPPVGFSPMLVPATGSTIPWEIPLDRATCGAGVLADFVMFDPGAATLIASSRTLSATIGK